MRAEARVASTPSWLALALLTAGCRDALIVPLPETGPPAALLAEAPDYSPQDMLTLGGVHSHAEGINASHQAVGISLLPGGGEHAFFWSPESGMVDIDSAAGPAVRSRAWDINDRGMVVGESGGRAVTWSRVSNHWQRTVHGVLPGHHSSAALAVNNRYDPVGYSVGAAGERAVRFIYGGVIDLGTLPGGTTSRAEDVNDSLRIVGTAGTPGGPRAFLYRSPGPMQSLGVLPGGTGSSASGINNADVVVGYSIVSGVSRAFVWSGGTMRALPGLAAGRASRAFAINDAGYIAGWAVAADGQRHAVAWVPGGADYLVVDLSALDRRYPGEGHAINRSARVAGVGRVGWANHGYFWYPANLPPVAVLTGPDTTWTGGYVRFDGTRSQDPDGTIASMEWRLGSAPWVPGVAFGYTFTEVGQYVLRLRVTDNSGVTAMDSLVVEVVPNRPPVAVIANGNFTVREGQHVTLSSAGSYDPDVGQELYFYWQLFDCYWEEDYDICYADGPNPTVYFPDDRTYHVSLSVGDFYDGHARAYVDVVVENAPPQAVLGRPEALVENTAFRLGAAARDSGEWDRIYMRYSFDCGSGYTPFSRENSRACPGAPEGTVRRLGVRLHDGDAQDEDVVTMVTGNATPALTYGSGGQAGGTFTLAFSFTDPGGPADGPYRYRVLWGDGTQTAWLPAASPGPVQVTRPAYPPGSYLVRMYVADNKLATGALSRTITIR